MVWTVDWPLPPLIHGVTAPGSHDAIMALSEEPAVEEVESRHLVPFWEPPLLTPAEYTGEKCLTCFSKCSYAEGIGSCFQNPFQVAMRKAFYLELPFIPQGIWPRELPSAWEKYPKYGDAGNTLSRTEIATFLGFGNAQRSVAKRCQDGCKVDFPGGETALRQQYIDLHSAELHQEAMAAGTTVFDAADTRARLAMQRTFDASTDKTPQRNASGLDAPGCHVALHRRVGDTVGTDRCLSDAAVLRGVEKVMHTIANLSASRRPSCDLRAGLTLHVFSDRNIYVPDFASSMQAKNNNYDQLLYATAMVQMSAIEHEHAGIEAEPDSQLYLKRTWPVGKFHKLTFGYLERWARKQGIALVQHTDADLLTALYGLTHADALITAPSQMSVRLKAFSVADLSGFGFFDWCGDPVSWSKLGYYDLEQTSCYEPYINWQRHSQMGRGLDDEMGPMGHFRSLPPPLIFPS